MDTNFDSDGILGAPSLSAVATSPDVDETYLYVGGYTTSDFYYVKYRLDNGNNADAFGNMVATGQYGDYTLTNAPFQAGSDNYYTAASSTSAAADMYFVFKNIETYTGMNTVMARYETSCGAATNGISYSLKIRNFDSNAWDNFSNSLECSTTDQVNVTSVASTTLSSYINSSTKELWIEVVANAASAATIIRTDFIYIGVGTTNTDSGTCEVSLGTQSGGKISENPSAGTAMNDRMNKVFYDGGNLYMAGYDTVGGDGRWRIEKRSASTGVLDATFGPGGVTTSDPSLTLIDEALSLAVDSSYVYIAGYTTTAASNENWRVEKRDKTTGALVSGTTAGGWTEGVLSITPSANSDRIRKIAIDSTYMYLVGEDRSVSSTDLKWRIEKRKLSDGTLETNFDTDGIIQYDPTAGTSASDIPYDAAVDGSNLYVVGSNTANTSDEQVNAYAISNGASVYATSTNPGTGGEALTAIAIDSTYMYVGGYDATSGNEWRIEKRNLSNANYAVAPVVFNQTTSDDKVQDIYLNGSNIYVAGYASLGASISRFQVNKYDTSLALVTAFDTDGLSSTLDGGLGAASGLTGDGTDIYIVGYGSSPGDNQILIEKRNMTTGDRSTTFGSGDCSGTRAIDTTGGDVPWYLQTVDESNTFASSTIYGRDYDGDGNVEEAAGANLSFSITLPAGATLASINYANRYIAGSSGTIQAGLTDRSGMYSAVTGSAVGNRYLVGVSATTAQIFTDPIERAAVGTIAVAGIIGNGPGQNLAPEFNYDSTNHKINMALVTTSDGVATDNSVYAWDFAMVSPIWIGGGSQTPKLNYTFVPTDGQLVVGAEQPVTAATAAATADGTNLGSWRATLADDGYHWKVAATSTQGLDMQLILGNVELNSANQLLVETEIDASSASLLLTVQICDWVSSSTVDSVADSQCTGGGWRTLNSRKNPLITATATSYQWNIYNGYWSDGSNNSINTPLSNFVNGSNQMRIRYFSDTRGITPTIAVDFLRVFAVINSTYFPSALNVTSGVASGTPITSAAASGHTNASVKDSRYLYTVGDTTAGDWYIEKRNLYTGNFDTGFGTSGVVTGVAASESAQAIAIDSAYMYVVGSNNSNTNDWRIEKRLLSTGALDTGFDTDGIVDGAASSNSAYSIAIDSTYMYIVGDDSSGNWRIEKRLLSTGALCTAGACAAGDFDSDGIVDGVAASQTAFTMAIDSTYMYVAGYAAGTGNDWRIEKRRLDTGAVDTGFDSDGIVDDDASSNIPFGMALDSTYMYVVGTNSNNNMRIEKRRLDSGALCTAGACAAGDFDSDGIVDGGGSTQSGRSIALDSTYMYVGGNNSASNFRTEKRLLTTGALDTSFGSSGIVDGPTVSAVIRSVETDATYIYAAGYNDSNDWYYQKFRMDNGNSADVFGNMVAAGLYGDYTMTNAPFQGASDNYYAAASSTSAAADMYFVFKNVESYTGMNTVMARYENSCGAATNGVSYKLKIRNFDSGAWDDFSNSIECSATDETNITSLASTTLSSYINSSTKELWIEMVANTASAATVLRTDFIYIGVGTTNTDSGTCEVSLGTQTAGRITENPSSGTAMDDQMNKVVVDGGYLYMAGNDTVGGDGRWRMEKRDATTGALVDAFGVGGVATSDPSSTLIDEALSLAVDSSYIYVVGYTTTSANNENWYAEKRDKTTGALVSGTTVNGWAEGVLAINPSANNDRIRNITIDSTYMYLVGEDRTVSSTDLKWRIEKRKLSDGTLETAFDSDGIIQYDPTSGTSASDIPRAAAVDATNLYIVGGSSANSGDEQVNAYAISNGASVYATSTNLGTGAEQLYAIAIDASNMYVAGNDATAGNQWRVEKRSLSTANFTATASFNLTTQDDTARDIYLSGGNIYVAGYALITAAIGRMQVNKYDATTLALVTAFDADGQASTVDGGAGRVQGMTGDGTDIYMVGFGTSPGDQQVIIEKRNMTTGDRSTTFGSGDCTGTRAIDTTSVGDASWYLQTVDESTAMTSTTTYARDYDGDAVASEEAAAANLSFSATLPSGATLASINYANRYSGGPSGTVQAALSDRSGMYSSVLTSAVGNRYLVGTSATTAQAFTDPTERAAVGTIAVAVIPGAGPGQNLAPEFNYDFTNHKINMALVTTADGTATDNSVYAWDFAMVSLVWNAPVAGVTLTFSGTIYDTDETTAATSTPAMKLVVNGVTAYTATAAANGTFSFTSITSLSSGDVVTIWLNTNGSGPSGSLTLLYGSSCSGYTNCTGLSIVKNQVRLASYNGANVTNATLASCDNDTGSACADTDIGFTSNSNVLSLTYATNKLKIPSGTTYVPNGNVSAQDLDVAGTLDANTSDPDFALTGNVVIGGTLTASNSGVFSFGGNWTNNGTFNHSSGTVISTITNAASATIGGSIVNTFYNFTSAAAGKSLLFKNSTTTTFAGILSLNGTPGNPLTIKSDSPSVQWKLDLIGNASVSYLYVIDSGCSVVSNSVAVGTTSNNGGNNGSCWIFISVSGGGSGSITGEGGGAGGSGGSSGGGSGGGGSGGEGSGGEGGGDGGGSSQGGGGAGGGGGSPSP